MNPGLEVSLSNFLGLWNQRVALAPLLQLDFSWPSTGVLDLLLRPIAGKAELSESEKGFVRDLSTYSARIVQSCWGTFNCAASLSVGPNGVEIQGRYEGGTVRLPIEAEILRLLKDMPDSIPVFRVAERLLPSTQGFIGPLLLGCCLGLSPKITGAWENETPKSFERNIHLALNHLGRTCVAFYERVFPDEHAGQFGELYLASALYPPLGIFEQMPVLNATQGVLEKLKELKFSSARIRAFAGNLAKVPDEHLSSLGLVLFGALSEGADIRNVAANAERKGKFVGLLRPALVKARELLNIEPDWISSKNPSAQKQMKQHERALGFLPWLSAGDDILGSERDAPNVPAFLRALADLDMPGAIDLGDRIIAESPKLLPVRLQRIYLRLLCREFDAAEAELRALLTEPGADENPQLFSLWGINDLCRGEADLAVRHLEQAYSLVLSTDPLRPTIANDYGWALLRKGEAEKASLIFEEVVKTSLSPLAPTLNWLTALNVLGAPSERINELKYECLMSAPLDPRVFLTIFETN